MSKAKEEIQTVEGVVTESLPNASFRVKLDDGRQMLCHLAGKMKIYRIRVLPGDRVRIETTPYDEARGRIVYKLKEK